MSNFERVLSDAEIEKGRKEVFSTENPYCPCGPKTMRKAARWAEQAVLAKLSEQEPVMYARTYNGEIDWDEACVTEANDGVLLGDQSSFDDDGNVVVSEEYAVIPLYAHPMPETKEHHRTTKNHIPVTDIMTIPEGYALVPVEPTEEMHLAARDWSVKMYGKAIGFEASHGCYKAMLAAAPKYTEGK